MKISTLITQLESLKKNFGDLPVILQSDAEGNDYDTIRGAERTFYEDGSTSDCREEAGLDAQEVIVIYP
jgi:hypothetical protein